MQMGAALFLAGLAIFLLEVLTKLLPLPLRLLWNCNGTVCYKILRWYQLRLFGSNIRSSYPKTVFLRIAHGAVRSMCG